MSEKTYIIAEAGVNHNGDEKIAHELVALAAKAGADAVKFQLFNPAALVTQSAPTAAYQAQNLNDHTISQKAMLESLCLPDGALPRLQESCRKHKIDFLCTPFDHASLEYLVTHTQMPYLKLPSGEITNGPLLLASARTGLPIILSSGMSNLEEIAIALSILHFGYAHPQGNPTKLSAPSEEMLAELQDRVVLLHCVSQYPAPVHATNLRAMQTMHSAFGLPVGLSDHTLGISMPIAAVARGAVMIEKHFTYDVKAHGPDHAASLTPEQLSAMVQAIRDVESARGDGQKICQPEEKSTRDIARKSVVAKAAIAKGEEFGENNLTCKRPGNGPLAPNQLWQLLGKKAMRDYTPDEFITAEELT
jgi:N-acetylneuraminate synthase